MTHDMNAFTCNQLPLINFLSLGFFSSKSRDDCGVIKKEICILVNKVFLFPTGPTSVAIIRPEQSFPFL